MKKYIIICCVILFFCLGFYGFYEINSMNRAIRNLENQVEIAVTEVDNLRSLSEEVSSTEIFVVNFGDSIYGNFQGESGDEASISSLISQQTGYTVVNGGLGGCRMSLHNVPGWAPFSMCKIADAIVSGDWGEQEASWSNRYELNLPYYFGDTISELKEIDWREVDIITIQYGYNDWISSVPLFGENPLDCESFCGALKYTIETLLTQYPTLKIVVQTPTPVFIMDKDSIIETSDTYKNEKDYSLVDLINEEHVICKEFRIPVIDAYYNISFNSITRPVYYNSMEAGVHLGINGRKVLANLVSKYLLYHL